ncbi:unnamed protein product [Adineta steineri]|uniref:Uncharacterized protein n=1 Tax=Adineta steineri TaxID=433720 RepID=A0A814HC92_9BILA|nr:unnamed protein product [Adineta steineri]CAF1345383.1 unnamed protein product [Adineta steineri]
MLFNDQTSMRYVLDFRATASQQFQVLRELCKFSQTAMYNDIEAFYDDELISAYLLSESFLESEMVSTTEAFRTSSVANFLRSLAFARMYVFGNQFMTGIQNAYMLQLYSEDGINWYGVQDLTLFGQHGTIAQCQCSVSATCNMWSAFYNYTDTDTRGYFYWSTSTVTRQVANWFAGCWPLESLLMSSLNNSFLNNQNELDAIATYFNWSSNSTPTALNIQKATDQSVTFNDTLANLFIENISAELNYSLYFTQCRPRSCFYSINQHSSFLYIFTALLGLYGGLSVVLRLLIPYVVGYTVRYFTKTPRQHPSDNIETPTQTWTQRVQTLAKLIWHSLVNLNLFKSALRQQPSDIKQQRWTTRIYITLLIAALAILTLYGLLNFEMKLIQVNEPSFSTVQQLQTQSQFNLISSLQCPCTNLTVPYDQFIQLQPFYHQICSSDFVSDRWIDALSALEIEYLFQSGVTYYDSSAFMATEPLFVLLKALCNFSTETVANSLHRFEQTQLVGTQLLTADEFTNQMSSAINQFELETTNTFLHFLQLLRNITHVNQILSGSGSSFNITIAGPPNYTTSLSIMTYNDDNSSNICSCANDSSCKSNIGLFIGEPATIRVYSLPEFYFACQPVESLLQSTLKCFYDDQDCLDIIINFYNVSSFNNFTRLNSSSHASHFMRNSTIDSLLSKMFIESWSNSTNYSSYVAQCQPSSCSYTIPQRNNLLETITRIVGLIGGLSVSLRILVPFLVMACIEVIRRLCSQHQQTLTEATSPLSHVMRVGTKIRDWFKKVNVFEDTNRTITIEQQCAATHVYLLLLIISLFIIVLYTSLTYYLNTFTITKPSLEQYQQLQQRYGSDAVSCPCSRLSITHSSFITLQCNFHSVCTSPFTSDAYLQELFQLYNTLDSTYATSNAFTLQGTIFSHFQALAALCNLVKDSVNDAQQQYLVSYIISTLMIDFDLFEKETNASLNEFQLTLPNSFLNSLQIIRGLMQGNGFVSAYSTNWYYITKNINLGSMLYLKPQYYGSDMCNCATLSTCTQSSTPYIKGYLVGCTPLESLLQSTLECLYEQPCIDLLTTYLNMSLSSHLVPLNKSETRFSTDDTVNSIVEQMFVETCSSSVSYNQFFEQCKPDYCSVTIFEPGSFIIVITTILGLYGGLTTFLKLVVPFVVFSTYKLVRKYKRRAQVGIQQIPTTSLDNNTISVDNTDHAERLFIVSNQHSDLSSNTLDSLNVSGDVVALGSVPTDRFILTSFLTSILRYHKLIIGFILFTIVVAAIIIPSVYLTRSNQEEDQSVLTVVSCTNLNFAVAVPYAVGASPRMVAIGDFNGDGILDFAVLNNGGNTVSVLLGVGSGRFGSQTTFPTGSSPYSIAVGDLNGDDRLDLAVVNYGDDTMSVLLGTGSGSFGSQTIYSTGFQPYWIVLGDLNSDGRLDLVVANYYSSNVGVFIAIDNGNFGLQTTYPTIANPSSITINDFNGDAHLDLVVISWHWPTISMLLGTGSGTFRLQTTFSINFLPQSAAAGDFNGDGRVDLVVTNYKSSVTNVGVLLGNGDGSFGLQTMFYAGPGSTLQWIATNDFNGDGITDVAVVNYVSRPVIRSVSMLLGTGNGSFVLKTTIATGNDSYVYGFAVADFNNDGRLDLAVPDSNTKNRVNIFLSTCT